MTAAPSTGSGMPPPEATPFQLLALCAQRPGTADVVSRLSAALRAAPAGADLVECSLRHGLAPLLLAHLKAAHAAVDPSVSVPLAVQYRIETRAAAVRRRVLGEAAAALDEAGIPLLVLKGAALAQLVYVDVACRPMRDVDLLVLRSQARRAYQTLRRIGFAPTGRDTASDHHHLPGLFTTEDGTTIIIELHHQLLPPTPFVRPGSYESLCEAAQPFDCNGIALRTLGREDMVWHVYAHAFAINTLCPGFRLTSLADLVHSVEAWVDVLDWEALGRRYPRLIRALPLVHDLVPWSARVSRALRVQASRRRPDVRPISGSMHWSATLHRDVLWPPDWWFRMRYGIRNRWQWLWYRGAGHPLCVSLAAARTLRRRLSRRLAIAGPHPLLDH